MPTDGRALEERGQQENELRFAHDGEEEDMEVDEPEQEGAGLADEEGGTGSSKGNDEEEEEEGEDEEEVIPAYDRAWPYDERGPAAIGDDGVEDDDSADLHSLPFKGLQEVQLQSRQGVKLRLYYRCREAQCAPMLPTELTVSKSKKSRSVSLAIGMSKGIIQKEVASLIFEPRQVPFPYCQDWKDAGTCGRDDCSLMHVDYLPYTDNLSSALHRRVAKVVGQHHPPQETPRAAAAVEAVVAALQGLQAKQRRSVLQQKEVLCAHEPADPALKRLLRVLPQQEYAKWDGSISLVVRTMLARPSAVAHAVMPPQSASAVPQRTQPHEQSRLAEDSSSDMDIGEGGEDLEAPLAVAAGPNGPAPEANSEVDPLRSETREKILARIQRLKRRDSASSAGSEQPAAKRVHMSSDRKDAQVTTEATYKVEMCDAAVQTDVSTQALAEDPPGHIDSPSLPAANDPLPPTEANTHTEQQQEADTLQRLFDQVAAALRQSHGNTHDLLPFAAVSQQSASHFAAYADRAPREDTIVIRLDFGAQSLSEFFPSMSALGKELSYTRRSDWTLALDKPEDLGGSTDEEGFEDPDFPTDGLAMRWASCGFCQSAGHSTFHCDALLGGAPRRRLLPKHESKASWHAAIPPCVLAARSQHNSEQRSISLRNATARNAALAVPQPVNGATTPSTDPHRPGQAADQSLAPVPPPLRPPDDVTAPQPSWTAHFDAPLMGNPPFQHSLPPRPAPPPASAAPLAARLGLTSQQTPTADFTDVSLQMRIDTQPFRLRHTSHENARRPTQRSPGPGGTEPSHHLQMRVTGPSYDQYSQHNPAPEQDHYNNGHHHPDTSKRVISLRGSAAGHAPFPPQSFQHQPHHPPAHPFIYTGPPPPLLHPYEGPPPPYTPMHQRPPPAGAPPYGNLPPPPPPPQQQQQRQQHEAESLAARLGGKAPPVHRMHHRSDTGSGSRRF